MRAGAGEFTCGEERLVLDGYGGGTYYEMAENGVVVEHTGARKMNVESFFAGHKMMPGMILGMPDAGCAG